MLFSFASPVQRHFDYARRTEPLQAGWVQREEAIMGTAVSVELWADDRRSGDSAAGAVMDEMHRIDRCKSPHRPDFELCRINRDAARQPVALSEEMFDLIERALALSQLTQGSFDISYAAVGRLYGCRFGVRPGARALEQARACVGWRKLLLDRRRRTLRFAMQGMCIVLEGRFPDKTEASVLAEPDTS